jgi:large subunit ribosomal protein LX
MAAKKPKGIKNIFRVTGSFKKGKKNQKFTKELIVDNKQKAGEYILSIIGSKHRVKRREITITKIEELAIDKVTDPIIKQMMVGK